MALVGEASARGLRVLALGQHDDPALRAAALDAGASRFLAFRRIAGDGPALLAAWLNLPNGNSVHSEPEAPPA